MKLLAFYHGANLYAQDVLVLPLRNAVSNEDLARILDHKVQGVKAALLREVDRHQAPLWRTEELAWTILITDDDYQPSDPSTYVQSIATAIKDIYLAEYRVEVMRVAL